MTIHSPALSMNTEPTANDAKTKSRILLTTSLVCSPIVLDSNIVAVSLPAIGQSLSASFTDIEWVVSSYLLIYASLLQGYFLFQPGASPPCMALIDGNTAGWSSPSVIGRFAGALVLFVAFWIAETRQERPMIDFSLFENRTFLGSVAAMVGYGAAAQVMVFYLPLFLQMACGFDAKRA